MLVIGVTGQTGAGKGTVCKMLEKYGLYHIDADKVAHSVYKKGSDVLSALSEAFGEDILNTDGTANRAKIAARREYGKAEQHRPPGCHSKNKGDYKRTKLPRHKGSPFGRDSAF